MSVPEKFRTAFNGFNREDVVSYLEYINNKHSVQVSRMAAEADALRAKLENCQSSPDTSDVLAALEQERNELRAQLEAVRAQNETLQARCDALETALGTAQNGNATPAVYSADAELEMYRRAERTERMARERANVIYRQTNDALSEAYTRVNEMTDRVVPIADQILLQLNQLQNSVHSAKQSLQDAAGILNTLQTDNN